MRRNNLKYSGAAKGIAIVLLCITVFIALAGGLSSIAMWRAGVYKTSQEAMEKEIFEEATYYDGLSVLQMYLVEGCSDNLYNYGSYQNIEVEIVSGAVPYMTSGVEERDNLIAYEHSYSLSMIYDIYGLESIAADAVNEELKSMMDAITEELESGSYVTETTEYTENGYEIVDSSASVSSELKDYFNEYEIEAVVYVDGDYPVADTYYFTAKVLDGVYMLKPIMWPLIGISSVLAIVLFAYLTFALGWHREEECPVVSGTARVPYEVFGLLILCFMTPAFVQGADSYTYGISNESYIYIILGAVCLAITGCLLALGLLDFSVRWKTGTIFSNTLVVKCWKKVELLRRGKQFGMFLVKVIRKLGRIIPLIWMALVLYVGVSFWGLVMVYSYSSDARFVMWLMANVIVFPILAYSYYMFYKLRDASKAIGNGDLQYKVNTNLWIMEFKEMGDNLNSIGEGMEEAIKEKMKSEHMKTELISNVSHDIKTPLTSIINYADLISKEETENEKIHEYSGILLRQSDRLKRLTEDLVHASKVTSGNVEVKLVPCNIGVLLNQAIGEYEEKLLASQLQIVQKQPKQEVLIQADGRHLWRVFDNLLNNICKYAQEGTRVYLTLKEVDHKVEIEFKNISKYELNISEDELMERFVRGDKSRHSEGNGLGLSIAKSLMEVQGGSLELAIDGDLFKVIVKL